MQSINDLGPHHQFLARGVATVEDTLREGEAYLLATQLHRSRVVSHQVEAELATAHNEAEAATHEAATTNPLSTASKVAQVTDMVAKLVEALTQAPTTEPAHRPLRATICWDCGSRVMMDGIILPTTRRPIQQPRCLAFSYADAVKARRTSHSLSGTFLKRSSMLHNTELQGKSN